MFFVEVTNPAKIIFWKEKKLKGNLITDFYANHVTPVKKNVILVRGKRLAS
jgi:hypothetical protein